MSEAARFPERPDVVRNELWYYDDDYFKKSVMYLEIEGASPDITNHLSVVTMDVMAGECSVSTDTMTAHLRAGDRVSILPTSRYSYVGNMALLVTAEQALIPNYVTFNNQQLGKEEQKVLRRRARQTAGRMLMEEMTEKLMPAMLSLEAMTAYNRGPDSDQARLRG